MKRYWIPSLAGSTCLATMSTLASLATLATLSAALPSQAALIESTPTGGSWNSPTTWTGGIVPGVDDDVRILGAVAISGPTNCHSVEVSTTGSLTNGAATPSDLFVTAGFVNDGTVSPILGLVYVHIGGDISNTGTFAADKTILSGTGDRSLFSAPTATFDSHLYDDPAAGGQVLIDAPFRTVDDIELEVLPLVLEGDTPLTMGLGFLDAHVIANGNEIRFESWSYIEGGTFEDPVLIGEVSARSGLFKGEVVVEDVLQNVRSFGNAQFVIEGHLINNGTIRNDHYGLSVNLKGDLTCNGRIECSILQMDDAQTRTLTMGPDGVIDTILILPEFGNGSLQATTNLRVADGISLGPNGTMTLPANSTFFLESGSISGGTLFAAGAIINQNGLGSMSLERIDRPTFSGACQFANVTRLTGNTHNAGTLRNQRWGDATLITEGTFSNAGSLEDLDSDLPVSLTLRVEGDLINVGTMTNSRVEIAGDLDQSIAIGASIDVGNFVLESGLDAATYQWFKDGEAIPLANGSELEFAGVDASHLGAYQCVGDGTVTSRTITLETEVTSTDGPNVPSESGEANLRVAGLTEVAPNPVTAQAGIRFHLTKPGFARLAIYDASGRERAVLTSGALPAGEHQTVWNVTEATPGVYFARLSAGEHTDSRKIVVR